MEKGYQALKCYPVLENFPFIEKLSRLKSIESDLMHFVGENWPKWTQLARSEATTVWERRIENLIAQSNHAALLSHLYTRYMGDLSGGQIFRKKISKMYGLPEKVDGSIDGLEFYTFREVHDVKQVKEQFKTNLNNLDNLVNEKIQSWCTFF
jgi:heme oxygenase